MPLLASLGVLAKAGKDLLSSEEPPQSQMLSWGSSYHPLWILVNQTSDNQGSAWN